MSQLQKKSASFRSRIPVRRARFSQRRCCSPHTFCSGPDGIKYPCGCPPYRKLRTSRTFACAGVVPHRSNSHIFHSHRHPSQHSSSRRYSSSSFSSSDESCESEAPHQKLARQSKKVPLERSIYVSTDAISLDGLLDSVSCGSFSSPPSPVHYQNTHEPVWHRSSSYESLDKYNITLDNLQITENVPFLPYPLAAVRRSSENSLINQYNNKLNYRYNNHYNRQEEQIVVENKLKSAFRQNIMSSEARHQLTRARATTKPAGGDSRSANDEASKKSFYMEKQKQLSDWYYIKSKNVVLDDDSNDELNTRIGTAVKHSNGEPRGTNECGQIGSGDIETEDSLPEHNYVNCARQVSSRSAIKCGQPAAFASLSRRAALGSARYAAATCDEAQMNSLTQQTVRWNNFDRQQLNTTQQQQQQNEDSPQNHSAGQVRKYNVLDDIEAEYNEAVDAINSSELKSSSATTSQIKPICPPYYCPPSYTIHHNHASGQPQPQQLTSGVSAENVDLSNVNVRLLKQHYQQQYQQPQRAAKSSSEYANMSFRKRVEAGKRNKNKVELQLEHWESMGNNNSVTDVSQAKFRETTTEVSKARSGVTAGYKSTDESHPSTQQYAEIKQHPQPQHQHELQQEQQQQLSCSNVCFNNSSNAVVNATSSFSKNSNSRSSNCSDNINTPHNNHGTLNNQRTQQQCNASPGESSVPDQRIIQEQQNFYNQVESREEDSDQDVCLRQPAVAPRRQAYPLTTTHSKAPLRPRQLQKRPDETSCSSFEQLNIVGIPTSDNVEGEDSIHALNVDVGESTLAVSPAGDACSPHDKYENHYYKDNADDREYRALKPVATDQSSIHGFLDISEDVAPSAGVHNLQVQEELANRSNTSNRPLPEIPKQLQHQQIQLQLQQNPQTRQLFGIVDKEMYPPKTTPSCRSDCELSGSYASLECPSPPGPPISLPESRRDPQARLGTYLRTFYTDLSLKEPIIPQWAIPVAPGALCAARLEPELKLNSSSHGFSDSLTVDQILVSLQTKEGNFLEAPRRCLIECPSWSSRSNLCLRILHAWAKEPPWPTKGTPVALALLIPLAELKRSLAHYVEKELLAKGPLNPFSNGIGNFSAAWNSLEALGPKLLLVLDGYDSQKLGNPANNGGTPKKNKSNVTLGGAGTKHHYPNDVHDLLDGKLFPDARIIITTSTTTYPELLSIIQRHVTYEGLTWGRSASLLGGGQWGGPSRLLDVIQENVYLRKVVRTPLGCLAVTAIYDNSGGDLPTDELDITESILNCVAPEVSAIHVSELGRLALFCLKMKRPCFTLAEMRMYCSTPDSPLLGCLERNLLFGKTEKKKSEYVYHSICSGMMELLAANYIASLATRPGLLAAEITGMAVGDELDPDLLKVLKFAMTLLGDRAHVLLSRLTPLWLTPQIVFTLALAGGPAEDNLAALCDILGISKHPPISPLETKPLWVQVRSLPTDLMGWGMALKSPTCTLKNLEVIYQLEKHNLMESRKAIEIFLDSLIANESVSTLKLSSLIEMDVKDSEISYLANCVSQILLKPRLENFELVLTLLEEDPPILKLQSVVAALCRTIPRQPRLSFLLLDLTLSTSQLVQLCSTLEKCPNVTRLSLPHLRCERGAITALASLLNSRPINFLSLPSCWGARDDPPSSSGVSMGSGSGSSTGTSGLIKQGSLPGVPSPRSYAPGIFSSLPRGVFVPQSSLGRSATLPRQPLEQTLDKRSCDSVVSKTWYPTPACDGGPHNSGTLHDLLLAARDSYSKLHGLDLSKAQLSLEDSMCLGETVRLSNTLHTLKLEGSSRLSEVLPSVLGASESSCLQMLSIGSPRLSLEDSAIAMCARALSNCSTLRLLSLDGWSFRIENSSTLSILRAFLSLTSIRELSLANCRLQISLVNSDKKISHPFESRSVVVLKLAGAQATLADATIMRGPQLLQYIGGFPCLRELDLSAPARSGMGSTHTTPLILDDKCIINFFQNLHSHFGLLNTLKICHWVIHFDEMSKTLKAISKCMRNSPISHLKIDGISVLDRPKKQRSEVNFIHCFIASLPQIRWMGISLAGKKEEQITGIGNAVLDLKGYEIDIKLSESTIEHAKLMAQAISVDGKFDIKVSTFGTSSGILVHAEKSGTKSLTRK